MAEIQIINGDRDTVARIEWKGGWYRGRGTVRTTRDHIGIGNRIRGIIRGRRDLRQVQFLSRGGPRTVRGWSGFEGWLQALNQTLPAIGLYVDWDHIDFPPLPGQKQQEA